MNSSKNKKYDLAFDQRKSRRLKEKLLLMEALKDKSDILYVKVVSELKRNEQILQETIIELEKQRTEKEILLKEIHHRVKNNLQIVSTLLRFQEREIKDSVIIDKLKATRDRIMLIAKMHENMYKSIDLIHIDLYVHFEKVLPQLIDSYTVGQEISLDLQIASDIKLGMKTIIPLGLLINKIITNSCKYAFKGRKFGEIGLSIQLKEDNFYELIIKDNGVGFETTSKSISLGSQLIEIFAEQLGGNIKKYLKGGIKYVLNFKSID